MRQCLPISPHGLMCKPHYAPCRCGASWRVICQGVFMPSASIRFPILGALIAVCLAAGAAQAASPAPDATATPGKSPAGVDEAASYSLGIAFATEWKEGGLTDALSEAALVRGIHDALGGKPLTTDDRRIASGFLQNAYERLGARNKKAAQDFLARNAKEPGVKTTASGLQYVIVTPGDASGPAPGPSDRVTVNYRGTLLNGTEFDSSYAHGQPAS